MWADLPNDVRAELEDPEYANRQHFSRATYALGCRGPLCRLRETQRGRSRNEVRAKQDGREYRPALDLRKTDREDELNEIVAWYLSERGKGALVAPVSGMS